MPPVRRRLFVTPSPRKRIRLGTTRTPTGRVRRINKRTTRGPRTRGPLRAQLKSLQSIVKNLAPEIKYADVALTASNIPTTGAVVHITAIAQGDTQSTRTGNTVNVTSLSFRGSFAGATDVSIVSYMRILIVVDKQQVADTSPAAGDIITSANPVNALPNLENLERFRILHASGVYDLRRMQLDTDLSNAPTQSAYFDYSWTGNIKVSYNGTATSDIEKNGIYFVILSDVAAATSDFGGSCRVAYTDI